MPTLAKKPATTPIPVQLSDTEFHQFIVPHLSMPKRGPQCTLSYHGVFNNIGREEDDGADQVRAAYGLNYQRLAELKKQYDSENLFRHNQNLKPAI
jgi:hypothetical protein